MSFQNIEKERFDKFSNRKLLNIASGFIDNIDRYPDYIRYPYSFFESQIRQYSVHSKSLIDLCCGDGIHSFTACEHLEEIVGIDFSRQSIELCNELKLRRGCTNSTFICADVLQFQTSKNFDIVIMAGSMSYFNHKEILIKIHSLLATNGVFILVDSLNDNIFYRFNRFLNFLKGERSYYTISNIPNLKSLTREINANFMIKEVKNFGIFVFLVPILRIFYSHKFVAKIISDLDRKFAFLNRYSFKTVIVAKKL